MTKKSRAAIAYLASKGFTADDYRHILTAHRDRAAAAFRAAFSECNGYCSEFTWSSGYDGPALICRPSGVAKAKKMSPVKLESYAVGDGDYILYPAQQWIEEEGDRA